MNRRAFLATIPFLLLPQRILTAFVDGQGP
jgi:hypothetical protein